MGMDLTGASGNYFRANVWSWRPICCLVEDLNQTQGLGLNLNYWHTNDGAGLHSQEECNRLADALEGRCLDLERNGKDEIVLEEAGMRVHADGTFTRPGDDLSDTKSPYSASVSHVWKFVNFLRNCGGSFEIC